MAEILSEREMISHLMEKIIDEATRPWGVKVERVEIKVWFILMCSLVASNNIHGIHVVMAYSTIKWLFKRNQMIIEI